MAKLTSRQKEIVTKLAAGESQKNISRQLGVSYSTVRNHLRNARDRTECRTSLELAYKAGQDLKQP